MTSSLLESSRLVRKRRQLHAEAQNRYRAKRRQMNAEEGLQAVLSALTDGELTRKVLGQRVRLFGAAMDAVLALGLEEQLLDVREGSNHPIGGGPVAQFWSLRGEK